MKEILKLLPWAIVGTVSFVITTIIDIVLILLILSNKIVRLVFGWLMNVVDVDETYDDLKKDNDRVNSMVNYAYKYIIDLMYPEE